MWSSLPVNLTAEAQAAQRAYEEATGLEERIEKLEKFISLIPKHKSSEKMVALYRHRLTVLRQEQEERRARRKIATGTNTSDWFPTSSENSLRVQKMPLPWFVVLPS